jgi:hypothetical protein
MASHNHDGSTGSDGQVTYKGCYTINGNRHFR